MAFFAISGRRSRNTSSGTKPCSVGVGIGAVVLDAMGDVQRIVHAAQVLDEQLDLLVVVGTAQLHLVSDDTIALLGLGVLGVEGDDLGQIHGVGSTMMMCAP